MTMNQEKFLTDLGLSPAETKTYLALLHRGPSSIRKLSAFTSINRGTTYEAIKALIGLGLVSYKIVGKRSRYTAESPENINNLITEKQKEIAELKLQAQEIVPNLLGYATQSQAAPKVRFYEGDEGVASILHDVISTVSGLENKEYYVYSSRALRQYLYRRFPNFTSQRVKEKIFVKVIAIGTGGDPLQLAERRFLKESAQEVSSSYNIIYGDKVALISVSGDLTPYGVVIEEPGMAAMQRLLFNQLWRTL